MNPTWAGSEPPRGSGWVRRRLRSIIKPSGLPTRYREVVLTLPRQGD